MSSRPASHATGPHRWALGCAVLVALLLAGACATGDGRTLHPPAPGVTAPLPPHQVTVQSEGDKVDLTTAPRPPSALVLASDDFGPAAPIPVRFACDGDNLSPSLRWANVPDGTVELALTATSRRFTGDEVRDFIHWVVTGIEPTLEGIEEGAVPEGAVESRNDISEFGWFGPCPDPGEREELVFTVFALSEPTGVEPATDGIDAIATIAVTPGEAAVLAAGYTAPGG